VFWLYAGREEDSTRLGLPTVSMLVHDLESPDYFPDTVARALGIVLS
jgi:hypothetical protein